MTILSLMVIIFPNETVLFNRIQGASWFSKMDCKSGYWQISMDEESIPLTAFSTP